MRKIAHNEEFTIPPTIEDPGVLEEIKVTMKRHGLVKPKIQFEEDLEPDLVKR